MLLLSKWNRSHPRYYYIISIAYFQIIIYLIFQIDDLVTNESGESNMQIDDSSKINIDQSPNENTSVEEQDIKEFAADGY